MKIRMLKHSVTNGEHKARVFYSKGKDRDGVAVVTIYARDYSRDLGGVFPNEYHNETDSQTDYFDKGHVSLRPGHPLYEAALARCEANEAAWAAHRAKLEDKRDAANPGRKERREAAAKAEAERIARGRELTAAREARKAAEAASPAPVLCLAPSLVTEDDDRIILHRLAE